jgi:hypothetical protein
MKHADMEKKTDGLKFGRSSICPNARIKAKISGQKNSNSHEGKKSWKNCDDALNFEESSILEQQ